MRKPFHRRAARAGLMLGSLIAAHAVVAGEPAVPVTAPFPVVESGLAWQMPAPLPVAELLAQVRSLRSGLREESDALATRIEARRFGAKDALIAAIMPGGLLYAAFRKHSADQARKELDSVSAELEELNHDLLALRVATGEVLVAGLR
ncbi:MAG: hypothetical protein PHF72_02575 [Gammaproteobacteria bacterium]|nr:hypothetical protein [Gammaproteobacteria bacterium]